jgi:hypothetical protein
MIGYEREENERIELVRIGGVRGVKERGSTVGREGEREGGRETESTGLLFAGAFFQIKGVQGQMRWKGRVRGLNKMMHMVKQTIRKETWRYTSTTMREGMCKGRRRCARRCARGCAKKGDDMRRRCARGCAKEDDDARRRCA